MDTIQGEGLGALFLFLSWIGIQKHIFKAIVHI